MTTPTAAKALRKFRFERIIGRYVGNPAVAFLGRLGIHTTYAAELETIGRATGLTRRVPVSASFDATGAWVISQHGRRSGWARNIADNSTVSIRQGSLWRTGIARFVDDDDPAQRARSFASSPLLRPLVAATFRALQSDPISVRIDYVTGKTR